VCTERTGKVQRVGSQVAGRLLVRSPPHRVKTTLLLPYGSCAHGHWLLGCLISILAGAALVSQVVRGRLGVMCMGLWCLLLRTPAPMCGLGSVSCEKPCPSGWQCTRAGALRPEHARRLNSPLLFSLIAICLRAEQAAGLLGDDHTLLARNRLTVVLCQKGSLRREYPHRPYRHARRHKRHPPSDVKRASAVGAVERKDLLANRKWVDERERY